MFIDYILLRIYEKSVFDDLIKILQENIKEMLWMPLQKITCKIKIHCSTQSYHR